MSYFVTCTHEQRILNGTSSDTSLCHWGTWKKKFSQTSQISQIWPDLARSGQIWDVWENFFFKKKNFFFQIWPDLGGPDLEIWPDLAASVYCVFCFFFFFFFFFLFFVLGLVFYENRKEKGRNGEDNKDNKMNRKWKRKKEMEK